MSSPTSALPAPSGSGAASGGDAEVAAIALSLNPFIASKEAGKLHSGVIGVAMQSTVPVWNFSLVVSVRESDTAGGLGVDSEGTDVPAAPSSQFTAPAPLTFAGAGLAGACRIFVSFEPSTGTVTSLSLPGVSQPIPPNAEASATNSSNAPPPASTPAAAASSSQAGGDDAAGGVPQAADQSQPATTGPVLVLLEMATGFNASRESVCITSASFGTLASAGGNGSNHSDIAGPDAPLTQRVEAALPPCGQPSASAGSASGAGGGGDQEQEQDGASSGSAGGSEPGLDGEELCTSAGARSSADCARRCFPDFLRFAWTTNGLCDDGGAEAVRFGAASIDLNCSEFDYDGGECLVQPPPPPTPAQDAMPPPVMAPPPPPPPELSELSGATVVVQSSEASGSATDHGSATVAAWIVPTALVGGTLCASAMLCIAAALRRSRYKRRCVAQLPPQPAAGIGNDSHGQAALGSVELTDDVGHLQVEKRSNGVDVTGFADEDTNGPTTYLFDGSMVLSGGPPVVGGGTDDVGAHAGAGLNLSDERGHEDGNASTVEDSMPTLGVHDAVMGAFSRGHSSLPLSLETAGELLAARRKSSSVAPGAASSIT